MSLLLAPTREAQPRPSWRRRAAVVLAGALAFGTLGMTPASAATGNNGTLTFTVSGGNATITGLVTGASVPDGLVIPASITDDTGTYPVTALGASAFRDKTLSSVTLPSTLTSIGNRALQNTGISEIVIPSGVVSFGSNALSDNHLTSLVLPDSVTTLGSGAFINNEIADLTLSNSLTAVVGFSGNKLTTVTIPDSVTSLSASAFAENEITAIVWGSGLKTLATNAFKSNLLTQVTIPSSVTEVGTAAFGANPLESVRIESSNVSLGLRSFWRLAPQDGEQGFDTVTFAAGPPSAIRNGNDPGTVNSGTVAPSFATFSADSNTATTISTPKIIYPASQDAEVVGASGFTSPTWKGYASEPASEVVATAPVTPAAPTLTLVDNTDITVAWAAPADGGSPILGYTVTLTPAEGEPLVRDDIEAGTLTTTFEDLAPGSYTATVVAKNAVGSSDPSPASASKVVPTTPATPAAPTAALSDKTVTVTWTAPDNRGSAIIDYTVTLTPADGEPQVKNGVTGTSTSFTGLAPGTYSATVVARNALGNSEASPVSNSVEVVATAPAAPTKPSIALDLNTVTVTWAAPGDNGGSPITGYTVTLTPADGTPLTKTVGAGDLSVEFTGVPGGTWTATVVATNAVNDSAASPASDEVAVPTAPAAPAKPSIERSGKNITVTWSTPNNGGLPLTGYEITLTPSAGGSALTESAGSGATSVTFTDVAPGTYTATVVASNELDDSEASPASDSVTIDPDPTAPATPAKPTLALDGKNATVSWTAPSDGGSAITGYTVTLTPATGTALTKNAAAGTTSVMFENLSAGTYTATVVAKNSVGSSAASPASASVTVPADPAPVVGTSVTASVGSVVYGKAGKVTVTVTAASGGVKPTGSVSTKVGGKTITGTLSNGTATLTLPAKSLKPGTSKITVTYAGASGKFTGSSKSVSVKVAKAKPTVKVKGPKKVKRGKTATYTVTVTAPSGIKPTGKVTVKVAGVKKTVKLNAKGKATVKIKIAKKTKPSKQTVTVTYAGNTYLTTGKAKATKTTVTK